MRIRFEPAGDIKGQQLPNKSDLTKIYSRTFGTKDGKVILEDLANISGMYSSNFTPNNSDYISFLEGHRALFLYICAQLEDQNCNIGGKLNAN